MVNYMRAASSGAHEGMGHRESPRSQPAGSPILRRAPWGNGWSWIEHPQKVAEDNYAVYHKELAGVDKGGWPREEGVEDRDC